MESKCKNGIPNIAVFSHGSLQRVEGGQEFAYSSFRERIQCFTRPVGKIQEGRVDDTLYMQHSCELEKGGTDLVMKAMMIFECRRSKYGFLAT